MQTTGGLEIIKYELVHYTRTFVYHWYSVRTLATGLRVLYNVNTSVLLPFVEQVGLHIAHVPIMPVLLSIYYIIINVSFGRICRHLITPCKGVTTYTYVLRLTSINEQRFAVIICIYTRSGRLYARVRQLLYSCWTSDDRCTYFYQSWRTACNWRPAYVNNRYYSIFS